MFAPAHPYVGFVRPEMVDALEEFVRRGRLWQDISVTRHASGKPSILLTGNAKRRADSLGIAQVLVTFTHERANAVAFALAVTP